MRGPSEAAWIGIDVGATSVKAYAIAPGPDGRLTLRDGAVELALAGEGDFRPVALDEQLAQARAEHLRLAQGELDAARARVATIVDAVEQLHRGGQAAPALALCAPGRTDAARRGLLVVRNGPRDAHLLDHLAQALARRGLTRVDAPRVIHSDGTAAGWGEEHAAGGAFAGLANAYALGCGTGVSEALKLDRELLEPEAFPAPWPEPWRAGADGTCAEERIAMPALVQRWRATAGPGAAPAFPEPAARAGDPRATALLRELAGDLAAFVARRLVALSRAGAVPQRVVLGQRAATLLADARLGVCFAEPLRAGLVRHLSGGPGADAYPEALLRAPGFLAPSRLRAAPALGAVARTRAWARCS